jgi:hypothetical protein
MIDDRMRLHCAPLGPITFGTRLTDDATSALQRVVLTMSNLLTPPPPASSDSQVLELPQESAPQPTQQWPNIETPLRLVGSTGTTYCGTIVETTDNPYFLDSNQRENNEESNVFKSLQWYNPLTGYSSFSHSFRVGLLIMEPIGLRTAPPS